MLLVYRRGNAADSAVYLTGQRPTIGVQSTRLILHFSSSFSTTTSIEMEGSRDTSNATSGDGVSKHYGFQTRPVIQLTRHVVFLTFISIFCLISLWCWCRRWKTVNLSNRDDKKYGDYDTSADTGANKAKDAKDGKDTAKPAGKDAGGKDAAGKDAAGKDQPEKSAKEPAKAGKN